MKDNTDFLVTDVTETYVPASIGIGLITVTSCFPNFQVTEILKKFHTFGRILLMIRIVNAFIHWFVRVRYHINSGQYSHFLLAFVRC